VYFDFDHPAEGPQWYWGDEITPTAITRQGAMFPAATIF
jgi:hypothetical protein